jgi:Flp pilus assembly protein TadD
MRWHVRPWGRLLFSLCLALALGACVMAQEQPKNQPKASDAEVKEARKVEAAADAQGRLTAAGAFLKKYPKSELRPQLAQLVVDKIGGVTDPAQRLTLAQNFQTLFDQPSEADLINPILLSAYLKTNRTDEAFALAAKIADSLPNPVPILTDLSFAGYAQAQQQNIKYVPQAIQYSGRAIDLLEGDKKPAYLDAATWGTYKTTLLPSLYQVQGFLLFAGGDAATAKTKLIKATTLNPTDAMNYALLGNIRNDEYQNLAAQYKAATGATQSDLLKQAEAVLDQIIDDYAHAVALAEGNPRYQALHDQLLPDLQSYYKYRHKGSTDGLQALIDKYKQPAAVKP